MTANKTPRKSNSVLSVAAIAAANNPTALMKLFGFSGSVLRGDPTWGVDAPPTNWIGLTASLHARFVTLPVSFDPVAPMFQIARINDPLVVCLFMAKHTPASFTFPMDSKQSRQWVVGVFDHTHMTFQNAMFLGTFTECVKVFTPMNLSKLRSLYATAVSALEPHMLAPLRTALQYKMLTEIDEAEAQHQTHIASIRNRHRNQLNYFTGLFDEAQERQDVRDKATYYLDFAGFPPSKAYSGLKVARRSHSKRNIPHIECHIIRCVGKNKTQFARWSTDDRVWLIL